MALVQYSDSESDANEDGPPRKIKKVAQGSSLPPLPATFHDLYASSIRVSVRDDPSLHGGRKRAIPHVEGNWPTHIYLEWYPSKADLTILSDIIAQIERKFSKNGPKVHSLLYSDLGAQIPLHISLSRPVVLRTEQRQLFMDALQATLQDSDISAFDITMDSLDCVSNFEKTRWFYVLRVRKPERNDLNRLLRISNRSLALFDQPPLYELTANASSTKRKHQHSRAIQPEEPEDYTHCFHISIAWSLTQPSLEEIKEMGSIDLRRLSELSIRFDCVKAKVGNQITNLLLLT